MSIQNPVVIAGKPADFPATGVTVIPLTAGGGAVVVSGSLSFVDPAEGTTGATAPATAVEVAGVDGGGVLRALSTDASGKLNVNTTVNVGSVNQGTPNTLANAWPVEISDGVNLLGVSANPIRVDPTGTTPQPVSGTVSINSIPAGTAVIGHVLVDSGAITVSGTVGLAAGTQVIGHVIVDTAPTTAVTGTFWQATQPVSIASMPSTPVTGTFFQATQPVSATSLPLPTGAAADSSLTTINTSLATLDTDLKSSQPRAVTQTTSPWVVSNNDGQISSARYQIQQISQNNDIFSAQPQNGFVPLAEVPAFLGGF